ncbi:TonB-dependent receptor [Splendidivirga corallicola]
MSMAQKVQIEGKVVSKASGEPIEAVEIFIKNSSISTITNKEGKFTIEDLNPGIYELAAFYLGLQSEIVTVKAEGGRYEVNFTMGDWETELDEVEITAEREETNGIRRLRSVEGAGIYEAKKSEVIILDEIVANLATNNSRQAYAKVPGLNIWESDGAGLQLGIGARGLDPNRTSNFNVRQNGYDISADALGYPESYYTPALEAVDHIQVVRGAASLQYGTQFGGLLNFILKKGPKDKPFELTSRQSVGSYGFFNSFNSIGGTKGKINHYTFYQFKRGDGWRPNSNFNSHMAYTNIAYEPSKKLKLGFQYTFMRYLTKQPGGLTDALFNEDPRQSIRNRNWFRVNWNLAAVTADYKFSDRLKLNTRNFLLIGGRDAVGNLGRIDRVDDMQERDLFVDDFRNFGNETRLIFHYGPHNIPSVLLVGSRFYKGFTDRKQGNGTDGSDANFTFNNPDNLEGSDFDFPSTNVSVFAENIFNISKKVSITPGVRFEYIQTNAEGYFQDKVLVPNPVTGIAEDSVFSVNETKDRNRSLILFGLGASYKPTDRVELYGNFSQNYRAINFNDIRVVNPNLTVDPNIKDETGYNFDLGIRGHHQNIINFDASIFYLKYNGRIGAILRTDNENFRIFRYRTNIADSRHIGTELFTEVNLLKLIDRYTEASKKIMWFSNVALIDAKYISEENSAIDGNEVELVPSLNIKTGLTFTSNKFKISYQYSYTQEHFSDASNAKLTPSAVEGLIPSYSIMDLSLSYKYKFMTFESGVNNLLDEHYFTRRAAGYPGPGIIPSDGRTFYFTLQIKI